ncbi:MAG: hypothetical protein JSV73_01285 [Flavobacteriaceae bacterium]|nr:MAG: hypothetical protein JSV73_01285 [Flavobacteriaceae bacterium]
MDQSKKDILNQIKDTGHGFEVPVGYFEKLEHRLRNEDEKRDSAIPDRLETGFVVPEGYFEETDSIFPVENEKKLFRLRHPKLRILSLSIAASILLFFGIRTLKVSENASSLPEYQYEDIATWVDNGLIDFEPYEIAEAFSDIELDQSLLSEEELFLYFDEIDVENLMIEN